MAYKQELTYRDGTKEIHFTSSGEMDRALCGQDLAGDTADWIEGGGYDQAQQTMKKVDCKYCIEVVEYCKSINNNEFKRP